MAEEVRQTSTTPITPESSEAQPEADTAVTTPTVFFRGASAAEVGEPSTSIEDSPESTYPNDGTNTSKPQTNTSSLRKQLIFQCDFSVAEIESLKSMYLSGKDLKHLDLDDLLKSPVLTPSYQVTKLQLLQTQLEASLLNNTQNLSAHNSLVDTVTIANNNFLKLNRDAEESIGAGDPEEKCAIANSTPVSVLNHLSTDLTEDPSDNGCASLFNDYILEPGTPKSNGTSSSDVASPGPNGAIRTNQSETPKGGGNQECMKPKTSNGGAIRDDNNKEKTRHEELKDVISVLRALEMANDKRTPPRSEQTLEHNAEERKVCDHVVSNLSPVTTATGRKDLTRKEIVHLDRNEESVIKSVNISFSQEKVKVITDRLKEDIHQAMKVTTSSETKEMNTPEQEKELSEYPPINLDIGPLLSRELENLVSHQEYELDDVKTSEYLRQNNDVEILRKEGSCVSEMGDTLPLENRLIPPKKKRDMESWNETKNPVDSYSSKTVNISDQNQNSDIDSCGATQDILIQADINTSLEMEVTKDDKPTKISSWEKLCGSYQINNSITDEILNYGVNETDVNKTAKIESTGIIDQQVTRDQNDCKTDSFTEIVDAFVDCQTDNISPLRYYDDMQLNREVQQIFSDSMNSETLFYPDEVSRDPDMYMINLWQDTMETQSFLIKDRDSEDTNGFVDINTDEITEEGRKGPDSEPIVVFENNSKQMAGTDVCVSIPDSAEEVELKSSSFSFMDGMKENTDADRNDDNSTEISSEAAKTYDICKRFVTKFFDQDKYKTYSLPLVDQISVNGRTDNISRLTHHGDSDDNEDMNNVQLNTNTVRQIVNISENDHTFLYPDKSSTDLNEYMANLSENTIKTKSPATDDDGDFTDANVFAVINRTEIIEEERRNHREDSKPELIVVLKENDNQMAGSVANNVCVTITDCAVKEEYKNDSFTCTDGTNGSSESEQNSLPLKWCDIYKRLNKTIDDSIKGSNYGMNEIDVNMNRDKSIKDHNECEIRKYSINDTDVMEAPELIRREDTPFFGLDTWETDHSHEIVQTSVNRQTENIYPLFSYLGDEDNVELNREEKQIACASENSETCPDDISKCSDETVVNFNQTIYPVIEVGDSTDANSIAGMNPTERKVEERKGSDSEPIVVFEGNTKQKSGPVEDTDGRVFVFKMAVTTCQTESTATLSPIETLENNDSRERKSPRPFQMSTSTSSILTVKNNDVQPIGSIRITCQIKEDFPDSEQSIISQEKVDVFSSKFTPSDYCGSNAVDTFMGATSPIDKTRIPGYHEAAQSIDFLKTTTTSINITECSSAPFNSIHSNSKQLNAVDDVIVESAIQVKPISVVEPIQSLQRNSPNAETEEEIQDVVRLKTSPCPLMIADTSEIVGTTNPLLNLETDAHKTPEKDADTISSLNEDGSPCPMRDEMEKENPTKNQEEHDSEQKLRRPDVVSTADNGENVQTSAGGEVFKVRQKIQTQNIESGTKSVTSCKEEFAPSHMVSLPGLEDIPIEVPNQKDTETIEHGETCDELSERNEDNAKICHFSGIPLLLPSSALIKPIPRTESSQIIRTENGREIFAKRVQFSQSSQKESTSFMMIKNICQVQQHKSYGQMNVVETGLGNVTSRKYYTRETGETCLETDATNGNKIQQTSFTQGVDKNTAPTRQIDAVPNSKKCPKSIIKKISVLEPIKDQEDNEVTERNSNRKKHSKKTISSNSKSEKKTTTVVTEAPKGKSSGDIVYHKGTPSRNYNETEKSDGKGDPCIRFADESNSKTEIMNSQRTNRKTKPNSVKCISLADGERHKYRNSISYDHHKKVRKSKHLQAASLESSQRTLSPLWVSTRKISPQPARGCNITGQSLRQTFNSPISPPHDEKNLQDVLQRLSNPSEIISSLHKLSPRKSCNYPSSGFHPRCNSPETDGALFSSNQREIFSHISNERILTKDSLPSCSPERLHSALSLLEEENQEVRHVPFSSGNQHYNSSSYPTVFPILHTETRDQMDKSYPSPNRIEFKMNGSSSNKGRFLQTLCNHFGDNESQNDSAPGPKNKNTDYPIGSKLNDLSWKNRQDLNRLSAPVIPPPPSYPSSPLRNSSFHHCCKNQRSKTPPIPKTFGKEHQNFKSLRELKALEKSLKKESSRISKPPQQVKFQPYIFTSLAPYYDTSLVRYMMEHPNGSYPGYRSRQTALGLCDPAEDLRLDTFMLPKITAKSIKMIQDSYKKTKKPGDRRSPQKSSGVKKSILPAVSLESLTLTKRQLTFSDVPKLRRELQEKWTMNAQNRINQDYERTKEDFYRLELNRLNEMRPMNRTNIRASYFAYLQNTPGSRKAIYECIQKQRHK